MLGQRIGLYQIVRRLGGGGMGEVYEAVHEQLGRRAAIKVLHPHLAADAQVTARFLNEGRAASVVDHPSIVQIFELGRLESGAPYIVMEFLRGESLRSRLQRSGGRLPAGASLRIIRQMGDALVAAHDRGVVHRDLKPENLMIVPDPAVEGGERAKLLDFGIAKLTEGLPRGGILRTQADAVLGTPVYMAPEQCQGAVRATDRSDVYAVGVMLYEMLTGHFPIGGAGPMDLMVGHMVAIPIPLREREPALPEALATLVHRMLGKNPEERPAMREVIAVVDSLLRPGAGSPPPETRGPIRRRALLVGAIAALVVAGIVASTFVSGPGASSPTSAAPTSAAPTSAAPKSVAPTSAMGAVVESVADGGVAAVPAAPVPGPVAKERQATTTGAPQRPPQPDIPFRPRQVWEGDYLAEDGAGTRVCGEGRTEVTVSITRVKGRKVDAVLEFVHPPTDHSGSYHLSGTYEPGQRRIAFRAGKWIKIDVHDHDRTEEFVAVGMDGRVAADGDTLSGRMTASPCTTVHLHAR
jgi:serine/threonine protein kinase